MGAQKAKGGLTGLNGKGAQGKPANGSRTPIDVDNIDFNKKILHASWHPKEDTIAVRLISCITPLASLIPPML